jgi:uncharacterized membrane protein
MQAPAETTARSTSILTVLAFAFAGAAIWTFPIGCAVIGAVFGVAALVRGERWARLALVLLPVAAVAGLLLSRLPSSFYD